MVESKELEEVKCAFPGCNKSLKIGICLRSGPNTQDKCFKYLNNDESMHLECYVSLVIEKEIEEYERKKLEKGR